MPYPNTEHEDAVDPRPTKRVATAKLQIATPFNVAAFVARERCLAAKAQAPADQREKFSRAACEAGKASVERLEEMGITRLSVATDSLLCKQLNVMSSNGTLNESTLGPLLRFSQCMYFAIKYNSSKMLFYISKNKTDR
jgi:hypothetical protein